MLTANVPKFMAESSAPPELKREIWWLLKSGGGG